MAVSATVYSGSIKSINQTAGWGFIACDATHAIYNKDMFVLGSDLGGARVEAGTEVTFTVTQGQKGPQAANVQVTGQGEPNKPEGQYSGTVKSYNETAGWGFIECPETMTIHNKDIFVMRSALPGGYARKGDTVSFNVETGDKGPQASDCTIRGGVGPNGEKVYMGAVKSWNPDKGWGFITCPETQAIYEKDIFVMRSEMHGGHADRGQTVRFSVKTGDKGPEATQVMPYGQTQQRGGMMGGMPAAMMWMGMPGMWGGNRNFMGSVKNWNAEKGWGFISCQATQMMYGKDIFVRKSSLGAGEVKPGTPVRFSVTHGMKGPEATNVKVTSGGGYGSRRL